MEKSKEDIEEKETSEIKEKSNNKKETKIEEYTGEYPIIKEDEEDNIFTEDNGEFVPTSKKEDKKEEQEESSSVPEKEKETSEPKEEEPNYEEVLLEQLKKDNYGKPKFHLLPKKKNNKQRKNKKEKPPKYESHLKRVKKLIIKNSLKKLIILIVICLIVSFVVYKHNHRRVKKTTFAQMEYVMASKFKLSSEKETKRVYKYDTCSIFISYVEIEGYEEDITAQNYLESIQAKYSKQKDLKFKYNEVILNGNKWQSLDIQGMFNNEMTGKSSYQPKITYHAIIRNGKLYTTSLDNPDYNHKCKDKYGVFIRSIELK